MTYAPELDFELPAPRLAVGPPEARGLARDDVLMLVARGTEISHQHAYDLPEVLSPGDVVVVNTSKTLPAALTGRTESGERVAVHLSTVRPGDRPAQALRSRSSRWVVELRTPAGTASEPNRADRTNERVRLAGAGDLHVELPYPDGQQTARLWLAQLRTPARLDRWLEANGQPIRYPYVTHPWPIDAYQTGIADTPGSAEMPSAGRILTPRLVSALNRRGVHVAKLVLHCGVSSQESPEPPYPEWYSVPRTTATLVNRARTHGRRVVAVGTTVVRALESAADRTGRVHQDEGWTGLVVSPERGVSTVDGLLTGWHEPHSSHLRMLGAIASPDVLRESYQAALQGDYLWHEFGDVHLLLAR